MCRYHVLYLEWVNQFITIEAFADYLGVTDGQAALIVQLGRYAHESQFGPII